jgi:tetratricopeptide (TPR) repeat protein
MFIPARILDPGGVQGWPNRKPTSSPRLPTHFFYWGFLLTILFMFSNPPAIGQSASTYSQGQRKKGNESLPAPSPEELYKRLSPSVFVVETLDAGGSVIAKGSAVAVASGEVVTNRHVIEEGVSWRLKRGSRTWPITVTRLDPDHDLCQLKAAGLSARPVPIRSSDTLAVGERVFAIGSPEGLELTLSEGLISGLREYQNSHLIQTTAPISPGSSGGGLFDVQGHLVGITTFFFKEGQNLNFALPGEWIQALAKRAVSSNKEAKTDTPAFQALLLMQVGFKAFGDLDLERASDAYHEALRLQPGLADAWYWLGAIDEGQAFKRVSEGKEPNWTQAHEKAIEAYTKALELRPDFAGAWCALGNSYFALGRKVEALHALQEAIRLNPRLVLAWVFLGVAYHDLGENQKALQAYQQALVVEPDSKETWLELGELYKDLQQYGEMAKSLEKAIEIDPSMDGAWFNLGVAYTAQGNRRKIIETYERMKTLRPERADEFFRKFVLP